MPRAARKKSNTGIYHIMLRGADRRIIFADDEDCNRFLDTVKKVKSQNGFELYVYCLMGNHVHLLIREGNDPLEQVFKRIEVSYVSYYNKKYELQGHLFQDRYRSEAVETDAYFMSVLRYICQNPVKAGLSRTPTDYAWLGCSGVSRQSELLDNMGHLTGLDQSQMLRYIKEPTDAKHLDDHGGRRLTDRKATEIICEKCACRYVQDIGGWETTRWDDAIMEALKVGVSIRQLARLTAISKAVIERVIRERR